MSTTEYNSSAPSSIVQALSAGLREAKPTNTLFTCLACQVAFPTSERQRSHYRTDWHKYNLKRKVADLSPVSAEQFAQKVLAQQAIGREEEEKANVIYECGVCRRSYVNENSFSNHLKSKKHRDLEFRSSPTTTSTHGTHNKKENTHRQQLFSDDEEIEHQLEDQQHQPTISDKSQVSCLFCHHISDHFGANLQHMISQHGFFLPDDEYLMDAPGLISYLYDKVVQDYICLFCNDRGKEWRSLEAVRAHMIDKGHCKMAYDDSEDPEALLQFYDFGPIDLDSLDQNDDIILLNNNTERLLENGTRIGHRQKLRYFKQRLRKTTHDTKTPLSIQDKEHAVAEIVALAESEGNPLNRKQRRQLLTDGTALHSDDPQTSLAAIQSTHQAQKEFTRKSDFQQQVAIKNNRNTTRRIRIQVPV
ncbi:C2H2 type zinc-finger-domain-containing protein [Halteromyces radiatus]|uniref:C2H2 type zinc-finger-domain-containing protein n=1 Tax=Halteromyces radiatus TaxID=101107 RepID=UPI00221FF61C|nr:C2H2 type zinc-finger-domain-containing protein [Halteromyces radiatus]KAI8092764.1 C2H2 type zinc-finger-domain-containing protein [Halteromyces radiatus]